MKTLTAFLLLLAAYAHAADVQPTPPQEAEGTIGYDSVDAALSALRAKTDVEVIVDHGWTIATDHREKTIWSFAPNGHPAFPAAVKRTLVERDGTLFVRMAVLCEASKTACDRLVVEFNELNERMRASMRANSD